MRAMECSFLTMVSNNIILCTCIHALLPLTPSFDFVDVSCCPLPSSLFALPVSSSSCRPVFFCCFYFPSVLFSSLHPSVVFLVSGYAAAWWGCVCFCQMSAVVHGGVFVSGNFWWFPERCCQIFQNSCHLKIFVYVYIFLHTHTYVYTHTYTFRVRKTRYYDFI